MTTTAMTNWLRAVAERSRAWATRDDHLNLVLVAVAVGLVAGLAAVGFRALIELVNVLAWRRGAYTLTYLRELPFWWKIGAPAIGGAIVGFIVQRFAPEAKGHGVPEVMEAVALRGGRIRPRVVLTKMFASAISIGSGGSVGREGPIVQVGSAIGSTVGQWLRVDESRLQTLVGCGAAAGIAAAFNAPIAGALFAAEIILGDFAVAQFSPIVISSVTATVVSRHFLGDFPAFEVPAYSLVSTSELLAYTALGLVAAFVSVAFVRTLYGIEDRFARSSLPPAALAMFGGALIGTIGLAAPQVFGVGYEAINGALNGTMVWPLMLGLVLVKIVAVSITIGSGGSGGVFAPSLFIGAMLGGGMGTIIHNLWPTATGTPGAYALVGMGAVVAGATHAPITAILIIFELTGDYEIILPLMIASIIATLLATRLQPSSIYTRKLLKRGIQLHRGRAVNVLVDIRVAETMDHAPTSVSHDADLGTVLNRFVDGSRGDVYVVDDDGMLAGRIPAGTLHSALGDAAALAHLVIAQDLMVDVQDCTVATDDNLADAMRRLEMTGTALAVESNGRLVGVLRPEDVIARYNDEILKREMVQSLATTLRSGKAATRVATAAQGGHLMEIPLPNGFDGQSLHTLDVRRQYGVTILMIRHADGTVTAAPDSSYTFRTGDILIAFGGDGDMERLGRHPDTHR
jgi:CIC family chloride channel protein